MPSAGPVSYPSGLVHEEFRFRQADLNDDQYVDILDYNVWLMCYGSYPACTASMRAASDLTDDGVIDGFDYNLWLREWFGTD